MCRTLMGNWSVLSRRKWLGYECARRCWRHTVAAGGGSLLHFDGGRFQVGPDSAGADPGPACYRRGGPLAVTDANVMVGKLQPELFPSIFGPEQNERLDAEIVRQKFKDLAEEVGRPPEVGGRRFFAYCGGEHGQCHQEDLCAAGL